MNGCMKLRFVACCSVLGGSLEAPGAGLACGVDTGVEALVNALLFWLVFFGVFCFDFYAVWFD
jgi:hypothetical protein